MFQHSQGLSLGATFWNCPLTTFTTALHSGSFTDDWVAWVYGVWASAHLMGGIRPSAVKWDMALVAASTFARSKCGPAASRPS